MKKQYIKDLADLYSSKIIEENVETGEETTNLNTPPELEPSDGGTGRVEGLQAPIDNKDDDDGEGISNKDITQKTEKEEEKHENLNEKSINNCTMSKTNIFDKLYATIMEADDLDDGELEIDGLGGDEESDLDELGIEDEGGNDVTVTLTADEADLLKSIVDKLGGDDAVDGDDLSELDDELDLGGEDDDNLMEGGATESIPEGKSDNPKGKNTVGTVKPTGGTADGKAADKVDDGDPKADGHKHGDNKPGDNKVGGGEWG